MYNYLFGDFVLFAKFKTDLIYLYLGFKELVSNTRRMSIVVDKNDIVENIDWLIEVS